MKKRFKPLLLERMVKMGLNDNIYTISKSIVSEKQEKAKQREEKEVLATERSNVKQLLLLELINAKKENINIYTDDSKDFIIHSVLDNYVNSLKDEYKKRFETKYKKEVQQHILLYYYNVCSQAERIAKKQQEDINDYKQQIALEKWELQHQKMQLQIEREKQKLDIQVQKNNLKQQKEAERIRQQQAQQTKQNIDTAFKVLAICCKVMLYMTFAPFLILALCCGGFLGGASGKGKKGWF